MGNIVEVILTIIGLSFWILFPIGMFLSVSHIDKNTDQIIRLEKLRHKPQEESLEKEEKQFRPVRFDWHHPLIYFRQWLQQ